MASITGLWMLAAIPYFWGLVAALLILLLFMLIYLTSRYRRCPSNRVLVIYGKGTGGAAKAIHGGGTFVIPLFQDYAYLSLEPMSIDIELTGALSKKNIRVNVPSTFTIGISTEAAVMQNAAIRLLGLNEQQVATQARDIILGQMRLVIATLEIEQINQDREMFLDLVNKNVGTELSKIGLEVINVNIRDITDESGYIEAIGQNAAAEAVNRAKVQVAEQVKLGAIGESTANREKDVQVAQQKAASVMGQKEAERTQRMTIATLEAETVKGEATALKDKEVAVSQQKAQTEQGRKEAESKQRIAVSQYEAQAVDGENTAKANIAQTSATLAERQAEAKRRGEVAMANATRDVLRAEAEQEQAKLEKTEVVQREIDKRKIEIDAEAEAERQRRIGKGQADAILFKFTAEAEGTRRVLEAKAAGYSRMIEVCAQNPDLAPTLLLIEKLPELVAEQVKAIQNLKIDKVTVWDNGSSGPDGGNATSNWLRQMIGALPPIHDLARQAGVKLPSIFGTVQESDSYQTIQQPPTSGEKPDRDDDGDHPDPAHPKK